jgi:hypothetical protein
VALADSYESRMVVLDLEWFISAGFQLDKFDGCEQNELLEIRRNYRFIFNCSSHYLSRGWPLTRESPSIASFSSKDWISRVMYASYRSYFDRLAATIVWGFSSIINVVCEDSLTRSSGGPLWHCRSRPRLQFPCFRVAFCSCWTRSKS